MTPAERRQRARLGGLSLSATHDMASIAEHARAGKHAKFLDEVDPQRILPEAERERRATAAEKAAQARLALNALQSRNKRRAG